jgi:DNA-binding winged helix-turn-helix (wHTH) protein/tetratricopeptide (TPR) repeat protein
LQASGNRNHRVELARTADFALGPLRVVPAAREVERDGVRETLEPRVMQVLVALAQAGGEVVGRDELIARCWEGRIVVDNAINRVISRLRRLSTTLGEGCFRIDTVARVGYRLVAAAAPRTEVESVDTVVPVPAPALDARVAASAIDQETATVEQEPAPVSRRTLLAAGAAIGLVAAGAGLWLVRRDGPQRALLDELVRKGSEATQAGQWQDLEQAVAYLEQATRIDPQHSAAWAALAVAHRALADTTTPMQGDHADRARAAAQRALAIEPGNAEAQVVLAVPGPVFGHWTQAERACRELVKKHPRHPYVAGTLARLLLDTGRNREAAAVAETQLAQTPVQLRLHFVLVRGRWGGGDARGAAQALERALDYWPRHPVLWAARSEMLAHQGRPARALELLEQPRTRPAGQLMLPADVQATVLRALVTRTTRSVDEAVAALLATRAPPNTIAFAGTVFAWLAMLGAVEPALAVAEDHLLGERTASGDRVPLAQGTSRSTWWLFQPPVAALHRHPRMASLTRQIGLDDYWLATGTRHDLAG